MNKNNNVNDIFDQLSAESVKTNPSWIGDGLVYLSDEQAASLGVVPADFVDAVRDHAEEKGYEVRISWECAEGEEYNADFLITGPVVFYKPESLEAVCDRFEDGKGEIYAVREKFLDGYVLRALIQCDIADAESARFRPLFSLERLPSLLRSLKADVVCQSGTLVELLSLRRTSVPESDILLWFMSDYCSDGLSSTKLPVIRLSEHRDTLERALK